jgi:anti-anti-sigma factor
VSDQLCSFEHRDAGEGFVVVTLTGEIDLSNAPDIEARIRDIADEPSTRCVVIDLGAVAYLDSAAFAVFERLSRVIAARLVLPNNALIHRAVEISGLRELIDIVDTVDDALR